MSPEVQAVLDHLRSLNVKFTYKEHPAVHTIAEMAALGLEGEEQVAKNPPSFTSRSPRMLISR